MRGPLNQRLAALYRDIAPAAPEVVAALTPTHILALAGFARRPYPLPVECYT